MWKNRSVLVTGATGLLGSHLVEALNNREAKVVTIVRDYVPLSRYYHDKSMWNVCDEVTGDVEDFDLVNRVINEYQVQTVFHLAAQTQVGIANKNPMPTLRTNIMGTVNVLEACRINKTEQVVIASSDKAYGACDKLPYDESTPLRGNHPYDVSKSCADLIAQMYAQTYDMQVSITRCGNLFGGGDLNFNRLIPSTIVSFLQGKRPVIRSNGTMIRDYFYVKDAVEAYLLLAEMKTIPYATFSGAFNFSYGRPYAVMSLVQLIRELMNCDHLDSIILNEANNEIFAQYLDSSKARSILGWNPKWTLEGGLIETIEWYKEML